MAPSADVKRRRIDGASNHANGNGVLSNGHNNGHSSTETSNDGFKPGYLLQVKVWNFTTYTYGEFNLSPTLNMIIGPNGTGKSTLVSAICLGLGGKIDLIKRKTLKSMIKSGFEESKIEITMRGRPVDHIIERKFNHKESKWKLDGRKSDERSIRKLVQSFNIQLDNLCHFLPQERVAEFAGLSPEKLLLETERTLGDGSLLTMHENLISHDQELVELRAKIDQTESRYNTLIEEKERLEEEAKKYEDYQAKTQDLANHNKLIPYAQIQDLKLQQKHLKKERDQAKKALEKFNMNNKPIEDELATFGAQQAQITGNLESLQAEQQDLLKQAREVTSKQTQDREKIAEFKHAIVQLKARSSRKLKDLSERQKEYDETVAKIEQTFPLELNHRFDEENISSIRNARDEKHNALEEVTAQLEEIERSMRPKRQEYNNLQHQLEEKKERLTSTDKLVVLENVTQNNRGYGGGGAGNTQELLKNTIGAHKLLRREHPQLKGKYFEAPVVSCEITDKRYAKYIEKVIDNNTLLCLSFTNRQDYDDINKIVFQKFNAPMRVITKRAPSSIISVEEIRRFGFDGYLSDFISGPKEVINMLNEISKLNQIPVSHEPLSEAQLNKLLKGDRVPFTKFLSGNNFFNLSRSRYGSKQLFYTTEKIFDARLFTNSGGGLTEHAKQELNSNIQSLKGQMQNIIAEVETYKEEIIDLKQSISSIKKEFDNSKNELDEIVKLKNLKQQLESRLTTKQEQIKKLEEESQRDCSDKVIQVEESIKRRYKSISTLALEIAQVLGQVSAINVKICHEEFRLLQSENKITTTKEILERLEEHKETLRENYQAAKAKYDEIKKSDAAKKIQEQSSTYTAEERQILGSLAASYLESETLTEENIRNKIKLIEEERSLMSAVDKSSMEDLQRKLQEIEFADKELPILKKKQEQLSRRIASIQSEWEPQITDLVNKISQTFRKRFTSVASDGQVEISKADRFKNWKLQILVKFRENSDLKVLDHQSQSGGERAVSTIFFIMSLQGLTDAPFRVVDEINQGMDPNNEKMAHKYLVHTACTNKSSQYFLVTPKLLTGLYYHPDMMIHCIYTDSLGEPSRAAKGGSKKRTKPSDFLDFARKLAITS